LVAGRTCPKNGADEKRISHSEADTALISPPQNCVRSFGGFVKYCWVCSRHAQIFQDT
jgi:hypothetical protein